MSDFFQWKEKRETVASEKEPSFGSDKKKDPAKKASDKILVRQQKNSCTYRPQNFFQIDTPATLQI